MSAVFIHNELGLLENHMDSKQRQADSILHSVGLDTVEFKLRILYMTICSGHLNILSLSIVIVLNRGVGTCAGGINQTL